MWEWFCMINTNMSLHHYRPDMILQMSLVSTLVLSLLVSLVVIVTWMLRKKLSEFSLMEDFRYNLKNKGFKSCISKQYHRIFFFGSCYNRSHNTWGHHNTARSTGDLLLQKDYKHFSRREMNRGKRRQQEITQNPCRADLAAMISYPKPTRSTDAGNQFLTRQRHKQEHCRPLEDRQIITQNKDIKNTCKM